MAQTRIVETLIAESAIAQTPINQMPALTRHSRATEQLYQQSR
jgi:hypothetical protein